MEPKLPRFAPACERSEAFEVQAKCMDFLLSVDI